VRCALRSGQRSTIERLRRERRPYREIAKLVHAPLSTVARYVRAIDLNRLEVLDPKPPVQRYEHDHPGELVHLDTKRLVRFRKPGHRVTGDRTVDSPGAGWEYLHVAIDDHSRIAYGEFCSNERGRGAVRFLVRLVRYYQRLGIRISRVLTER
jgi:hypothetical protein